MLSTNFTNSACICQNVHQGLYYLETQEFTKFVSMSKGPVGN